MAHRKILAQEMLEHVARQQASGMTIENYAKQVGVTRTKLNYWIHKIKNQEAENNSNLKFIDLGTFGQASDIIADKEVPEQTRCPQITLTFPNGICLKIY